MNNSAASIRALVLFSAKKTAVIAALPILNILMMFFTGWVMFGILILAVGIEGFVIWYTCLEENGDIRPFPRTLLAYLPSLLLSGAVYFFAANGAVKLYLLYLYGLIYFQSAVGIAATGTLLNGLGALIGFFVNRKK